MNGNECNGIMLTREYQKFIQAISTFRNHHCDDQAAGPAVFIGFGVLGHFPSLGAQAADDLRKLFGDRVVANLENVVYQSQDALTNLGYRSFGLKSTSPWNTSVPSKVLLQPIIHTTEIPTQAAPIPVKAPAPSTQPHGGAQLVSSQTSKPVLLAPWSMNPLRPFGTIMGEGQWAPYIQDASGTIVAYRTFLQPDPFRAYALPAIVAFDLKNIQLHFVLGSVEPQSSVVVDRSGRIPQSDLRPGVLLAAFNGGFKAQHGHFGVMVNGITLLPAKPDLGTIAIYSDGSVKIGAWGTDIKPDPGLIMWRQNGPLIIHNGIPNPHTAKPQDWSYTVSDITAVWRSGIGISADGRTLYYVAGPGLTASALTDTMASVGAFQAMQLDINNYWVHFDEIKTDGSQLFASPLLDSMQQGIGRFLSSYRRDYFYITGR